MNLLLKAISNHLYQQGITHILSPFPGCQLSEHPCIEVNTPIGGDLVQTRKDKP